MTFARRYYYFFFVLTKYSCRYSASGRISFKGAGGPFWGVQGGDKYFGCCGCRRVGVLYRGLHPYQPEPASGFTAIEETRVAPPSTEPIAYSTESASEMTAVSLKLPVLVMIAE